MNTVGTAMLHWPKVCGSTATVADARAVLADDHVHAALLVDPDGRLVSVVVRDDLAAAPPDAPARTFGRLDGRVTGPDAELDAVHEQMITEGVRRLAVLDERGRLLGLLCLKRTRRGFCSDRDVADRAAERAGTDGGCMPSP